MPEQAPANYREIDYTINGQTIQVGGMAEPDFERAQLKNFIAKEEKRDPKSSLISRFKAQLEKLEPKLEEEMTCLEKEKYDVLLGLELKEEIQRSAESHGIHYIPMAIEDYLPPSVELFEQAFDIIETSTNEGKKVGIHCGEGFGRTGSMLAAIKLKELMLNTPLEQLEEEKNERIQIGGTLVTEEKTVPCTPRVKQAIEAVRASNGQMWCMALGGLPV
jgi:protein-tyrosine phosphatase